MANTKFSFSFELTEEVVDTLGELFNKEGNVSNTDAVKTEMQKLLNNVITSLVVSQYNNKLEQQVKDQLQNGSSTPVIEVIIDE